ncbi:hypothetical protein LINGRAHAP2_LOCUS30026 [Linum grandiflorum]
MHCDQSFLSQFCNASGQVVSAKKSRIFFSKNISTHTRNRLCMSMGFRETKDFGKYLGVLVLHGRVLLSTYLDSKLASWKRNTVSLFGHATLATTVLNVIPSYAMQTAILLVDICKKILINIFVTLSGVDFAMGGNPIWFLGMRFVGQRIKADLVYDKQRS